MTLPQRNRNENEDKGQKWEKEWDRQRASAENLRKAIRRRRVLLFLWKVAVTGMLWFSWFLLVVVTSDHPWSNENPRTYMTGILTVVSLTLPLVIFLWPKRDAYGDLEDPGLTVKDRFKQLLKCAIALWIIGMLVVFTIPS